MLQALRTSLGGFLDGFTSAGLVQYLSVPGEPIIGFAPTDVIEGGTEQAESSDPIVVSLSAEDLASFNVEAGLFLVIDAVARKVKIARDIDGRWKVDAIEASPGGVPDISQPRTAVGKHGG